MQRKKHTRTHARKQQARTEATYLCDESERYTYIYTNAIIWLRDRRTGSMVKQILLYIVSAGPVGSSRSGLRWSVSLASPLTNRCVTTGIYDVLSNRIIVVHQYHRNGCDLGPRSHSQRPECDNALLRLIGGWFIASVRVAGRVQQYRLVNASIATYILLTEKNIPYWNRLV